VSRIPFGIKELKVDGFACRYPEYVWKVPIMGRMTIERPFWDMTEDERHAEYSVVASGGPGRVPSAPQLEIEHRIKVFFGGDVTRDENQHTRTCAMQIWMMPNQYTVAKTTMLVSTFSVTVHEQLITQLNQQVLLKIKELLFL